MKKDKEFILTKFPADLIKKSYSLLTSNNEQILYKRFKIDFYLEGWTLDSLEEFVTEYRKQCISAVFEISINTGRSINLVYYPSGYTKIEVEGKNRTEIEELFGIFEEYYERNMPDLGQIKNSKRNLIRDRIKVFIGHGRSPQWRDLKDHLQDKMGFKVLSYETGARAGYTITEVLEELSRNASIAFLVHTAEDLDKDLVFHARENVIHETGLFQGTLGIRKAIIILEEGANEYTNISGVQQIRYSRGNIKEISGDVVAIIYREFDEEDHGAS